MSTYARHQPFHAMRMCSDCLHPDDYIWLGFRFASAGLCFACRKPVTAADSTAVEKAVTGADRLEHQQKGCD